jgi:hypothetical protein
LLTAFHQIEPSDWRFACWSRRTVSIGSMATPMLDWTGSGKISVYITKLGC